MNNLSTNIWNKLIDFLSKDKESISVISMLKLCDYEYNQNKNTILIKAPNSFVLDKIKTDLEKKIKEYIKLLNINDIDITLSEKQNDNNTTYPKPKTERQNFSTHGLNPDYVFETFVVGPNNRLAHAASLAVAENPGTTYNPLFIWGGVGLGKTHLMHAIGHKVLNKNPMLKVVYVSSEKFTNELITAIQRNRTQEFKQKYRSADVLLIDDIQFLANKESTQEEFFHTFNSLYDAKKQIVISSDRPPKEIQHVEERLVSRFAWGIVTDIQPPDLETRIAILKKKAELKGYKVPDDVIYFLAQNIDSNIRELEGALNRVVMYSQLLNETPTIESVKEHLKDILKPAKQTITVEFIQSVVCDEFGISVKELLSNKRTAELSLARQIAMYLAREVTGASLQYIGKSFNRKDHTTVLHACKKIESLLQKDRNVYNIVEKIKNRIS